MASLRHHICKILLVLFSTGVATYGQTLEEDYNNGSINQREGDCWIFDDFEINQNNPINTAGGEKKQGATVDMANAFDVLGSSSNMLSPFFYFDGTGAISFKHKADEDEWYYVSSALNVYLIGVNGNTSSNPFDHVYKQLFIPFVQSNRPNGDPRVTSNANFSVPAGYYRVLWEWTDWASWTEFFIDDISIDTASTYFVEAATVCEGEIVQHTPTDAVTDGAPYNFEYTWSWVGTAGGTLTTQTTNDRTAQVDWNVGPGTYRLKSVETYDNGNCNGRTFYIDVTVSDQPAFAIEMDTVCQGAQTTMFFDGLAGKAPFIITYNDGSGSQVFTTTVDSGNVLLSVDATSVSITDVVDDNGCHADPTLLIAYPIYYHPKPSTGLIYHQ